MLARKRKSNSQPTSNWSELTSVIAINGQFLLAALLMFIACKLWPERPEWWGFGLFSICIGAGSIAHARGGIRGMLQLLERNRTVNEQTKDSAETKLSRKVTGDVLRDAGMKR